MSEYLQYALLVGLAIALVTAAITDLRSRHIANWLTGAVALGAPLFWWASGLSLWPDIALQLAVALAAFAILAVLFALRAMGGGDVKLLTALALWIAPLQFGQLVVLMALLGGALTLAFGAWHVMQRRKERLAIPYGVAISAAGLWVLAAHYFPAAHQAIGLSV
ncbi:prepilin peptidase [Alteriqipengyuania sp.]|uniref:A24 family peptidase n=1 Tax=Alteriqipengyuania sp. TaxID=2800692 RepID=UPI0035177959